VAQTFVEPISERKDGIAAFFGKQAAKAASSPSKPSSPVKPTSPPRSKPTKGEDKVASPTARSRPKRKRAVKDEGEEDEDAKPAKKPVIDIDAGAEGVKAQEEVKAIKGTLDAFVVHNPE
jgi:hypothetical protein